MLTGPQSGAKGWCLHSLASLDLPNPSNRERLSTHRLQSLIHLRWQKAYQGGRACSVPISFHPRTSVAIALHSRLLLQQPGLPLPILSPHLMA